MRDEEERVSAHKLGVCEGCFDGRKTWWMDLAGRYFDDHVDHCKVTKESVVTTKSRCLLRQKKGDQGTLAAPISSTRGVAYAAAPSGMRMPRPRSLPELRSWMASLTASSG